MIFLPTYSQGGKAAQVMLIFTRLAQGISVGGQSPGCHVLAISTSPKGILGRRGSMCHAAAATGFLLANIFASLVRLIFKEWDNRWRLPWGAAMLLIVPMITILKEPKEEIERGEERTGQVEKGQIEEEDGDGKIWAEGVVVRTFSRKADTLNYGQFGASSVPPPPAPPRTIYESYRRGSLSFQRILSRPILVRQMVGHVLSIGGLSACFNLLVIFIPAYISGPTEMVTSRTAAYMSMSVLLYYIIATIIFGKINDTLTPRILPVALGLTGVTFSAPFLLLAIETRVPSIIWFNSLVFATFLALGYSGVAAWQVSLWSPFPSVAYSGVSISHNLAGAAFGGTLPLTGMLIANGKIERNCEKWAVSYMECNNLLGLAGVFPLYGIGVYVSLLGTASLLSLLFITRHPSEFDLSDGNNIDPPLQGEDKGIEMTLTKTEEMHGKVPEKDYHNYDEGEDETPREKTMGARVDSCNF
ncbi:hypothetical protein TrCOL_g2796 [Triparma columacea]|uniref:Major facilitator superfamily (MFS) profile domain-containing protein n=1 Tax=Triparma columacea TaxID=722753 RepID=A0A9W7FY23_9STRA|nr:hypothetical protein TrCOL_g2796 [Triparma columacea]